MEAQSIILIGYSGHAFVVADALLRQGRTLAGYCDVTAKELNPYNLAYLGTERDAAQTITGHNYFPCVGLNTIRKKIVQVVRGAWGEPVQVLHPSAVISEHSSLGAGVLVSAGAVINAIAQIGEGVIVNTGAIVEHECRIGDYVHIAPGAVICGDVTIGELSFVGANSVIAQGLRIGANVVIGAGAVVLRDVPDNSRIVGNPGKSTPPPGTIE